MIRLYGDVYSQLQEIKDSSRRESKFGLWSMLGAKTSTIQNTLSPLHQQAFGREAPETVKDKDARPENRLLRPIELLKGSFHRYHAPAMRANNVKVKVDQ